MGQRIFTYSEIKFLPFLFSLNFLIFKGQIQNIYFVQGWILTFSKYFFSIFLSHVTSYIYFKIYVLLHFRFWGTCEEHSGLLHRYIHGNVVCSLHPHKLYLTFLPMLSLPHSLPLTVPPLFPPNRPRCVMLLFLCPCVLIIQHPPMSENMQCLIFFSCVSLLRMMVSRFIHVPTKDMNSLFFMAA